MYIQRHLESILKPLLQAFPAVLLTGARQVGKSTLLQHIAPDYRYLSLDDPLLLAQAKTEPRLFLLNHGGNLIVDEVQYAPELFSLLKLAIDQQPQNGRFLLSGSQAYELMHNVQESLAGRVAILKLKGLSLREIHAVDFSAPFVPSAHYLEKRAKKITSYQPIWQHIHQGDMPRLYQHPKHWQIYYSSYVATYIERDVRALLALADNSQFTRFMVSIAARSATLLNYASIAGEVGTSAGTIKRWIAILESAGIVYLLPPYSNNHLKRALKTPKIYMLDTGLMAYLSRWHNSDALQYGAQNGAFFESFVISQIVKSFSNQGIEPPLYYYRDSHQNEIDLLIEDARTIYPIEIKTTASPHKKMAKSFAIFAKQLAGTGLSCGMGVIINQYPEPLLLAENILALPIEYI